jgi:hypothetical protein
LRTWLRLHPYTAAGLVASAVVAVPFCLRQEPEWEQVFLGAAGRLWLGEDIYRLADAYLYPPFMALAALPFRLLPTLPQRAVWLLINLAGVAAMLRWGWRAAGGGRLQGPAAAPRAEHGAAVLGALCGLTYIHNCLAHKQTDVVIGALLLGGCLLLVRARALAAATCFGLAAAMKCTALLWVPYLLWRGRPRAAAWVLVVAGGVNLLPDLVHASPSGRPWLLAWADSFLRPLAAADHYVGTWASDPMYNQSLSGAVNRWCLSTLTWTDDDCFLVPRPHTPPPLLLRGLAQGSGLLLLLATLWAARGPWRLAEDLPGPHRVALESCAVLLLMLLLSPMSSKAHFGMLVLPGFCLARAAVRTRSRWAGGLLGTAVLLALLGNKDPLGERLYTVTLWCGCVTWQTLALLAGCLLVLRREGLESRAGGLAGGPGVAPARRVA